VSRTDDYVLVLNAGSSSLKFCVYRRPPDGAWGLEARGQIEGIGTSPRFSAKNGQGGGLASETLGACSAWATASCTEAPPTPVRPS
jgi:acetate kinase